jgi:precorrin-6A/cobalt-precorrin-6A reductase
MKVLILGGTTEAAELAEYLVRRPALVVTSSLAGRTKSPKLPPGKVRIGGFGGGDGLVAYLQGARIDLLVDATHPFAENISRNAASAARTTGTPLLALRRSPWARVAGDVWHEVHDIHQAVELIGMQEKRVFLTIGRQQAAQFAACLHAWFLIRCIDSPVGPLPLRYEVILERGPFDLKHERDILRTYAIDLIVSKNSGGAAAYAKIAAARERRLPVLMIGQPELPHALRVETVLEALRWIERHVSAVGSLPGRADGISALKNT